MSVSWKLTLPCTKAQAEAAADAEIEGAALVTTEEDEAAGLWRLDAYFKEKPNADAVHAVRALVGGAADKVPEPLEAQDWVTLSQAGLEPIREGRFVVHTGAFPAEAPAGGRVFLIEAGQAFGTGHHHTTAGCLAMLDSMAGARFGKVIDLGTGTGLLAFAARHLWPEATVTATDIDPVAIAVTRENAAANDVGSVALLVADGADDAAIRAGAPYDLVIANILAGPLIAMAAEITSVAAPGATIVLAGLLATQFEGVATAYRACGCTVEETLIRDAWTIVRLSAPADRPLSLTATAGGDRNGWATDGA